jgi:L-Lysine epsilon oxidase N-terminal
MPARFSIHPAIGIARLGNSPTSFCIASERRGAFPIDCDEDGNPIVKDGVEQPVQSFVDAEGRIRRQAARFSVFVYDDKSPDGREIGIGDTFDMVNQRSGQLQTVRVDDIRWTVYLANKKASWYEFQETDGEHGYSADHKLRNAGITDTEERQRLIIDPGPRSVAFTSPGSRKAQFGDHGLPALFPPPLAPNSITSLGDLVCTQSGTRNRLLVLGGFGNSGSMLGGFGNPKIETYANNDGWFDDVSDGPVSARLVCTVLSLDGQPAPASLSPAAFPVDDPAWVIVGYPRYVPEIPDIITMDDLVFDLAVRNFAAVPYLYGLPPFDDTSAPADLDRWRRLATWNRTFRP